MILEITFLLLLILIEAPLVGETEKCDCDCSCGRKHHLPSTYVHNSEEEEINLNGEEQEKDNKNEEEEKDQEPIYVGGEEEGEDGWVQLNSERALKPYRSSNSTLDIYRDRLISSNNNNNGRKDFSNRPRPPHLDRSVPDRKSSSNNRKKKDDYWCIHCNRPFCDLVAIQQHSFAVHSTTTMPSSGRKQQNQSIRSITPETDNSMIICEVCSAEFVNERSLDEHKTVQHPWAIFCSPCLLRFDHAQDAQDHYQLRHLAKPMNPRRVQKMLDTIKGPSTGNGIPITSGIPQTNPEFLGFTPFIPSSHKSQQDENHFMMTFPSHTVQTYYGCNECSMVFGNRMELESHQATPLIHGGRIYEADEFPPLGQSSKPADTSLGDVIDSNAEENTNAWGMPSFTLDEKRSEELVQQEWIPQARLTPEPDSTIASSEDLNEEVDSTEGNLDDAPKPETSGTDEIGQEEVVNEGDVDDSRSSFEPSSETVYEEHPGDLEILTDENSRMEDAVLVNAKSSAAQDEEKVEEGPMSSSKITMPLVHDSIVKSTTVQAITKTAKVITATNPPVLERISPRPIIQPVPSHITLTPYAKAALESAPRLGEYPPPEPLNDDYEQDAQPEQPKIIGGIECHVPSFFMPISPNKKGASNALPLTLDSTPPLTLNIDSSSSLNEPLVLESGDYEPEEEVYEITYSQPRQMFSLDLAAPANGNRPKPNFNNDYNSGSNSRSRSSRHSKSGKNDRKRERETYLSPAQREVYSNGNGRGDSRSRNGDKPKEVQPALQPIFESEWKTLDMSSTDPTGGRGGLVIKETPWDASRREAEERNRAVYACNGRDEIYGGW